MFGMALESVLLKIPPERGDFSEFARLFVLVPPFLTQGKGFKLMTLTFKHLLLGGFKSER